jgi:tRNA G18 (ribose-2'-O)-methylase SpoU
MRTTAPILIDDLADPRVAPYRNLKDHELDRQGRLFIAEGEFIVRRLLDSDFAVQSVLLSHRRVDELANIVPDCVPVYVTSDQQIRAIVGFKFHSGVIACGLRKPRRTIDEIIPRDKSPLLLVICPDIANAENLGALIRVSAGFGADAMILGPHCHDPFWRQSIRVSMGTVFAMPIAQSTDLLADISRLRNQWSVQLAATVLDENAIPLHAFQRPAKLALLFGNEAQGLDPATVSACDVKLTIPMRLGTDSLNVAVAAGIMLHHFVYQGVMKESRQ